jgi:hypothetical protein
LNSLSTTQQRATRFLGLFGRFLATCGVVILMSGCATTSPKKAEELVSQRAQARWDALVKSNLKEAYAFLSPGSRAALSFEAYKASIREGFWKSAQVNRVECASQEACEVHMTIEYEYRAQRIKTPLRETWIREGSDWWYVKRS